MVFSKRLRDRIRTGEITTSIRIWQSARVRPGGLYPMDGGQILVESIEPIRLDEITGDMARRSGFDGVVDLLKTARHGAGTNIYLIGFRYLAPGP